MSTCAVDTSWKEVSTYCNNLEQGVLRATGALLEGVAIFGAGPYGETAYRYLKKIGANIVCFVDNDLHKQGTLLEGIQVVSPREFSGLAAKVVFIAARHAVLPVRRQLEEMEILGVSFDAFFVVNNIDRIRNVRDQLLGDDRSRLIFDGILKAMLTGDESFCASIMEGNQYFALPEFVNIGTDFFVDAGAYVGDTVEKFIWTQNGVFNQIHAFEPGEPQFKALSARKERLVKEWAVDDSKIVCVHAGLAEEDKQMQISLDSQMLQCTSFGSSRGSKGTMISLRSLDKYLGGSPATFIKADIEGMEMVMLRGAERTIRKFRPRMALSIYHEPTDLFEIAEYVRSIVPEYQMAIRHHAPSLMDSVLYCWIKQ